MTGTIALTLALLQVTPATTWKEDARTLGDQLAKLHMNAYFQLSREQYDKEVAALSEKANGTADEEMYFGVLQFLAKVGDSHTMASAMPGMTLKYWGVSFNRLREGWYVSAALKSMPNCVGGKLLGIGKCGVDEIETKLSTLFAYDNVSWKYSKLASWMACASAYRALGMTSGNEQMRVQMPDGTTKTVSLQIVSSTAKADDYNRPQRSHLSINKYSAEHYVYEELPEGAIYLIYNRCASDPKKPAQEFFKEVLAKIDETKARALIIDLRINSGGNSAILWPLLSGLKQRPDLPVYTLIGRSTFSSGMLNAVELRNQVNSVLVGEPTGGSPNSYGEVKQFELPNSKIRIQYSTRFFKLTDGIEKTVMPDVNLMMPARAFFAGEDYVLDAVRARI